MGAIQVDDFTKGFIKVKITKVFGEEMGGQGDPDLLVGKQTLKGHVFVPQVCDASCRFRKTCKRHSEQRLRNGLLNMLNNLCWPVVTMETCILTRKSEN